METKFRIIRSGELAKLLGISKVTLWRMEKRGELPPKKKISRGVVGWLESDMIKWLKNRPNATSEINLEGKEK